MKTMPCPACKKQVSLQAEACPKCGHPITDEDRAAGEKSNKKLRVGCLTIFVALLLLYLFSGGNKDKVAEAPAPVAQAQSQSAVKTFPFRTDDFVLRFDQFMSNDAKLPLSMQYVKEQSGQGGISIQYKVNDNIGVLLTEDTSTHLMKEALMIATSDGTTKSSTDMIFAMGGIMDGCLPGIQPDDRGKILKGLGLTTGELTVGSGTRSYVHNGVKFWASMSKEVGLWFGGSPAE